MSKYSDSLNNRNRAMLIAAAIAMLGVGIAMLVSHQGIWWMLAFALAVSMGFAFAFSLPFRKSR